MDDSFAYSSKFRLRVLVQPVYPLRKTEYDKHLKLLRRHSRIALADVPAAPAPVSTSQANVVEDKRSILPALTPSPASRGTLQLDFIETWDRDLRWLEEFEAHRRVCAVIGIVDCAEWGQKLDDAVASFAELTLENAPQDAFAYRCYGFNPSDAVADNADGLVVVPNVGDLGFYMHTLLAEVCSAILAGLSDIYRGLENASLQAPHPYMAKTQPKSPTSNGYFATEGVAASPIRPSIASPDVTTPKNRAKGVASPVSDSPDTRLRKKHGPARIYKLQGDIYALAGRINEAANCYVECMSQSKATGDIVWQAAATEGRIMTMVYEAQPIGAHRLSVSSGGFPNASPVMNGTPAPVSQLDVTLLLGMYQQVLILYARGSQRNSTTASLTSDGISPIPLPLAVLDGPDCIHPYTYLETCFRLLRLQLLVFIYGESPRSEMLSGLLNPGFRLSPPAIYTYLTGASGALNRSDMLSTMFQLQQQIPHTYLRQRDRVRFLAAHTQVLGVLHTRRRQALFQQCLAVAAADSISARKPHGTKTADIVHSTPEVAGSSRVLQILQDFCSVYGLQPELVRERRAHTSAAGALRKSKNTPGWPDLQLQALRIAIFVSETLPDHAGAVQFTAASLQLLHAYIGDTDQYRLSQNLSQLHSAASKRNMAGLASTYWGPESLLVAIEVAALLPDHHPLNSTSHFVSGPGHLEPSFLPYAGRNMIKQNSQPTLVTGEVADFFVTLANPFLFEMHIESISIAAEGLHHTAYSCSVSLQPAALGTVTLRLLPTESGRLLIKGCHVKIHGCESRELGLRKHDSATSGTETTKSDEKLARRRVSAQDDDSVPPRDSLRADVIDCKVTNVLPLLQLRLADFHSEMLVLSQGESTSLTVMLENVSGLPITWLQMRIDDNHTARIRELLLDDGFSQAHTYRHELALQDAPAVSIDQEIKLHEPMLAGAILHQAIVIRGYPDLTTARFTVNYGSDTASAVPHDSAACFRQAILELNITGSASQAMHRRTFSTTSIGRAIALEDDLKEVLQDLHPADHCLAVFTCYNASSRRTFEVTASHQDDCSMRTKQRIDPGATVNLILPITRFRMSADLCNAPIPSLRDKQFVVGKDKTTPSDRRLFWYEQKMLETFNLRWREVGTRRAGAIELNDISLEAQQLDLLRSDPMTVAVAVSSDSGDNIAHISARKWRVEAGSFVRINVMITSLLDRSSALQISLTPHRRAFDGTNTAASEAVDVSSVEHVAKYFLLEGTAFKHTDSVLPGESTTVDFAACVLASGQYDVLFSISSHDPQTTNQYNEISLHEQIELHVA